MLTRLLRRLERHDHPRASRVALLIALACVMPVALEEVLPGSTGLIAYLGIAFSQIALGIVGAVIWVVQSVRALRGQAPRSLRLTWLALPAIAYGTCWMLEHDSALRLAFRISAPAMNRWIDSGASDHPSHLGAFPVVASPAWLDSDWPQPGFVVTAATDGVCAELATGFARLGSADRAATVQAELSRTAGANVRAMGDGWYRVIVFSGCP